jgi:hypothetical protein
MGDEGLKGLFGLKEKKKTTTKKRDDGVCAIDNGDAAAAAAAGSSTAAASSAAVSTAAAAAASVYECASFFPSCLTSLQLRRIRLTQEAVLQSVAALVDYRQKKRKKHQQHQNCLFFIL